MTSGPHSPYSRSPPSLSNCRTPLLEATLVLFDLSHTSLLMQHVSGESLTPPKAVGSDKAPPPLRFRACLSEPAPDGGGGKSGSGSQYVTHLIHVAPDPRFLLSPPSLSNCLAPRVAVLCEGACPQLDRSVPLSVPPKEGPFPPGSIPPKRWFSQIYAFTINRRIFKKPCFVSNLNIHRQKIIYLVYPFFLRFFFLTRKIFFFFIFVL